MTSKALTGMSKFNIYCHIEVGEMQYDASLNGQGMSRACGIRQIGKTSTQCALLHID